MKNYFAIILNYNYYFKGKLLETKINFICRVIEF